MGHHREPSYGAGDWRPPAREAPTAGTSPARLDSVFQTQTAPNTPSTFHIKDRHCPCPFYITYMFCNTEKNQHYVSILMISFQNIIHIFYTTLYRFFNTIIYMFSRHIHV